MKKKLLMLILSAMMVLVMIPSLSFASVTLPAADGTSVTFNVANDAELAEVVDILCNTENANYDTYKGKAITVQLGEGTFTGTYNIKQFPIWNYNGGSPDNPSAIGTHSEGNTGKSNIYRNESKFDTTRIEFKGAADNKTIFRGVFKIFGSGNCNDGPDNGRKTESEQYTYFTGINFSHETLGDTMPIQTYAQAAFVKIDKCKFEKIDRVKIGNSGTSGGYGVYVSITNSDFSNCNTALDGYAKDPTILDNLKVTNCGALLNIQNGETGFGDVTVKNCNITGLGNYVIRTNGGTKANISNTKIHFANESTDTNNETTLLVAERGAGDVITFSDCELDENLFFAFQADYSSNTAGVVTVSDCTGYKNWQKVPYKNKKTADEVQSNKVVISKSVAQVTDASGQPVGENQGKYDTLAAAITAVQTLGNKTATIKMLSDTTENVTNPVGSTITLDLNGKNISAKSTDGAVITNKGTLTIKDSTETGTYVPDASGDVSYSAGKIKGGKWGVDTSGTLNIQGGIITENSATSSNAVRGAGVTVTASSSKVTMSGGLITGNNIETGQGGGIGIYGSGVAGVSINVSGGAITKNTAASGGAVQLQNGTNDNPNTLTVSDNAYISYNSSTSSGGGIYAYGQYAQVNVKGGTISYNTTVKYGGGIRGENGSFIDVSSGVVEKNKSTTYPGGGIYCDGKLSISGGAIKNNEYSGQVAGSEIYMNYSSAAAIHEFSMSGGIIENDSLSGTEKLMYVKGGKDASNHTKVSISGTADIRGAILIGYAEFLDSTSSISGGMFKGAPNFTSSSAGAKIPKIISGGIYTDIAAGYDKTEKTYTLSQYLIPGRLVVENSDTETKASYPWMIGINYEAKIGDKKYETLDDAIDAATGGTADNPVTIEILVDEVSFTKAPANYTNIVGLTNDDGTPKTKITAVPATSGPLYCDPVDYQNTSSIGITFKNLVFHELGKITVAGTDTTIENCLFYRDAPSGNSKGCQLARVYGHSMNFRDCTFKNEYDAFYDSDLFNNGLCTFDGCKFENIGRYNIQFMSDGSSGSFIIKDCEFEGKLTIARTYSSVLVEDCKFVYSESINEVGLYPGNCTVRNCSFDSAYIGNVKAKEAASYVDSQNCTVNDGSDVYKLFGATSGTSTVNATYDSSKKLTSGLVVKTTAPTNVNDACKVAQIGENLYIVGYGSKVSSTSNKLTGGLYRDVPDAFVATGYKVVASGNIKYPFEVVQGTLPAQTHETVVTEKTESKINEKKIDKDDVEIVTEAAENSSSEGVSAALKSTKQDAIVKDAIAKKKDVTQAKVNDSTLVTVDIKVNVTATGAETPSQQLGSIKYDVTPDATVTVRKNGEVTAVQTSLAVPNSYLSGKTFTVSVGSAGINPKQVVHTCADGTVEVFSLGTTASHDDYTFAYDQQEKTVTVEITKFSVLEILGEAEYSTVSFDANGGTGEMAPQGVKTGGDYTLPKNGFTAPEGMAFKAWMIDEKTYAPGKKVTISEDTTVTAVWKEAKSNGKGGSSKGVQTGDSNHLMLYVGLFAMMVLVALGMIIVRGKAHKK